MYYAWLFVSLGDKLSCLELFFLIHLTTQYLFLPNGIRRKFTFMYKVIRKISGYNKKLVNIEHINYHNTSEVGAISTTETANPDFSTTSFNPGPFNPRLFNHELFKPMVQKFMVEKSRVEMSSVYKVKGLIQP